MKRNNRWFRLMAVLLMMIISTVMLAGCGDSTGKNAASTEDTAAEETQDTGDTASGDTASNDDPSGDWKDITEQPEVDISTLGGPGGVDVDLSKLSSTMVYAVVNDMLIKPNTYIGKTVRMNGSMSTYYDEETGSTYYACLIKDATACCAQGIEFSTTDEYSVEDYPAEGENFTVVGRYDLYEDNGFQYCILKDAVFE